MSVTGSLRSTWGIRRAICEGLEQRLLMAFGLTTTTSSYTVDVGADLVFSVARTTANSASVGDLTSTTYDGTQLEAPESATMRYSHYESGLSSSTVVTATTDPAGNWIEITCNDLAGVGVIQYYIAYKGLNNIYMATYAPGPNSPSPGEMRFIMYTNHTVLTNAPAPSNTVGNDGNIESTDIFGFANGTTASKYYGEYEAIDDPYHGLTGGGFGVFMNMGSRETSTGGPFFKDIDFQTTSSQSTELYNYMFSGHSETENFRPGLQGPYALQFTNGSAPATVDYSFINGLNLMGEIPSSGRGTLTGTASGVPAADTDTVALSNAVAQYWGTPDPTTGAYTIAGIKPGTYTETIYQNELAVGTQLVTITAGATTTANISAVLSSAYSTSNDVFRIGSWDGTPVGFLNANLIQDMHPSDSRMSPWVNTTYTVGTTPDSSWPMAEWEYETTVVGPNTTIDYTNTIDFNLTAAQASTAMTFRIGITRAGVGGRPIISVNGGSYTNAPYISTQPVDRGITVGNWRGNNSLYTYSLSTSQLHSGSNTIAIEIASGSKNTTESEYLQPWVIFDALDLVPTVAVASISLSPAVPAINTLGTSDSTSQIFIATPRDSSGNAILANLTWSTTSGRGSVDGSGHYTAPSTAGTDAVTVSSGGASATVSFNVVAPDADPTLTTAASASPSSISTKTTTLSALGADDGGASNLNYTWSTTGAPPAAVTFSPNGTNAAQSTIATFAAPGSYSFLVTITDAQGLSTLSTTTVTVTATATTISVLPASPQVSDGQSIQLSATVLDQFGTALATQPTISWSIDTGGVGSVNATGLYTAPGAGPGTATVRASGSGISGTSVVNVILSDIAGTSNADVIRLVRSGTNLNVYIGTPLAYSVPFSSLGALTVSAGSGNDLIIIDFSGGASPVPSAGLTVDGGSGTDQVAIEGTTTADTLSASSSSLTVDSSTIQLVNDEMSELDPIGTQPIVLGSLTVAAGTTLNVDPGAAAVMILSATPSLPGVLDLEDSQLTVTDGGALGLSNVTAYLKSGLNAGVGYWNGPSGIISSVVASDPTYLSTLGVILDSSNDVVVEPTIYGDADLNGTVNGADYQLIDNGYGRKLTGWSNGDFNYDGVVDGSDYALIDNAFNQTSAGAEPLAVISGPEPTALFNGPVTNSISAARPFVAKRAAIAQSYNAGGVFADGNQSDGTTANAWKLYIDGGTDADLTA